MTTRTASDDHAGPLPPVDEVLDVKGLNCPLPILKTKVAINRMSPGQVLHVLATDPLAVVDFRSFCARTGHELLKLIDDPEVCEFWIRKVETKT